MQPCLTTLTQLMMTKMGPGNFDSVWPRSYALQVLLVSKIFYDVPQSIH